MNSGIYMWTSPSGKSYIGQSVNLAVRKKLFCTFNHTYGGNKINCARKKYNHKSLWNYKVLEYCGVDKLDEREKYYIKLYNTVNNGYNCESGGHENKIVSDETKQKQSEAKKGENNPMYGKHFTEEHKSKLSDAKKGKHPTEETKCKMSDAKKGKRCGENHPMWGKHFTKEQKRKISESRKGKCCGEKNPNSKAVIQLSKNGEFIAEFSTMKEASEKIGRSISSISSCCGTKDKRTIVGGFKWIKAEDYYKQMESV